MADLDIYGIKRVNPAPTILHYASSFQGSSGKAKEIEKNSRYALEFMNAGGLNKLQPVHGTDFRSTSRARGISQLNTVAGISSDSIWFFDTETLGSAAATGWTSEKKPAFLEMPQVAFQERQWNGKNFEVIQEFSFATGISSDSEQLLRGRIGDLRKNPLLWNTYDDEMKRSLLDTILYSDASHYTSKEIQGMTVKMMSEQVLDVPSTNISARDITKELGRMESGLANLTNFDLVGTREETARGINHLLPEDAILAAYNSTFDQWVAAQHLDEFLEGRRISSYTHLDVMTMAQLAFENNPNYTQKDLTLESLGRHYFGAQNQDHFAMNDVNLLAQVAAKLESEPAVLDHYFETRQISPTETYIAGQGIKVNPNSYNRAENMYSFSLELGEDGKTFDLSQSYYQPSPIVKNHEYNILGQTEGPTIDGVQMYATVVQDLATDEYNVIMSQQKDYATDLFVRGHFERAGDLSPEDRATFTADRTRRAYDRLVDGDINYTKHDPTVKLERTLGYVEEFRLRGGSGDMAVSDVNRIASDIYKEKIEAWKAAGSEGSKPSFAEIRNAAFMEPVLQEEQDIWKKAIEVARREYPTQAEDDYLVFKQRGNFLSNVKQGIEGQYSEPENFRVGRSGEKLMELSLDVTGDVAYLNASDPDAYRNSLRSNIKRGTSQAPSDVQGRVHILLERVSREGGPDTAPMLADLRAQVASDLQRYGEVQNKTIDLISSRTYGVVSESKSLVGGVKGTIGQARFSGYYHKNKHSNQLKSKPSEFMDSVINNAIKTSAETYTGYSDISGAIESSSALSKKISVNNEAMERLEHYFNTTQKRFRMDQGEISKFQGMVNFKDFNIKEAIQNAINSFEQNNFEVALTTNDTTGRVELLFAPKELNVGLLNKSYQEMLNDTRVGKQVLPMMGANYGIDVKSGAVTSGYSIHIDRSDKGYPYKLISDQETYFERIENMPAAIRKRIRKQTGRGEEVDFEGIISSVTSQTDNSFTRNKSYVGFGQFVHMDNVAPNSATTKSIIDAGMVNSEPVVLSYMQKKFPSTYNRWEEYSQSNPRATLFGASDFWREEKRNFGTSGLEQIERGAVVDFFDETGVILNFSGVSSDKRSRGVLTMTNVQDVSDFGFMDSRRRETITKAPNILPIRRENLQKGMEAQYRIRYAHLADNKELYEQNVKRAVARNVDRHAILGHELMDSSGNASQNVLSAQFRIAQMNDIQISDKQAKALSKLKVEEAEILARLSTLTEGTSEYKRFQQEANEINRRKALISKPLPAVHEGQMIISQSMADSLVNKSVKEISLGQGENLPEPLLRMIAEQNNVEYVKGQTLGLAKGESINLDIEAGVLAQMGLIDESNTLTVGKIARYDSMRDGNSYSSRIATSNRIEPQSVLKRVSVGEDGQILMYMEEERRFRSGDKLMTPGGMLRVSADIVEDEIFELLETPGVSGIMEFNKPGRENPGAHLDWYNRTIQENIWEQLESVDFSRLESLDELSDEEMSLGVRRFVQKQLDEGVSLQDIDIQSVANESYLDIASVIGLTAEGDAPSLSLNPDTGTYVVDTFNVNKEALDGDRGIANIQEFIRRGREEYNLSEQYISSGFTVHNTENYSGTSSKVTWTFRENELESRRFMTKYEDGSRSLVNEAKNRLLESSDHEAYNDFAERLIRLTNLEDAEILEAAHTQGNVLVDMSGSFEATNRSNFRINDEGLLVIDGLSLPEGHGDNVYGSLQQANSIILFDDDNVDFSDITLGEYLKQNEAIALLQTQDEGERAFSSTYVPIVGNIEEASAPLETGYVRSTDNAMVSMAQSVKELNQAQSPDEARSAINKFRREKEKYYTEAGRIAEDSRRGSIVKKTSSYTTEHGGAYRIGMFNQAMSYNESAADLAKNALRESNASLHSDTIRSFVAGIEDNVLMANQIAEEEVLKSGKSKIDYIIDRLSDPDDTSFAYFGEIGRDPNQTTENIQTISLRANDNVPVGRVYIGPGLAGTLKADSDGDMGRIHTDLYTDKATGVGSFKDIEKELNLDGIMFTREEQVEAINAERNRRLQDSLVGIQEDMSWRVENITEVTSNLAKERLIEDGRNLNESMMSFMETGDIEDLREYIMNRSTMAEVMEDSLSAQVMGKNVGITDNTRMRTMSILQEYSKSLVDAGIESGTGEHFIDRVQRVYDPILQNTISSKKITAETMGITQDMPREEMLKATENYAAGFDEFLENLRRPSHRNIDETVELARQYDLAPAELMDEFGDVLGEIADVHDTLQQLNIDSSTVSLGISSGTYGKKFTEAAAKGQFSDFLLTDTTRKYVEENLPDMLEAHDAAREATGQRIASSFSSQKATRSATSRLSDVAAEGLEELGDIANKSRAYRKLGESGAVSDTLQAGLRRTMQSPLFVATAGLAAGWILSAAVREGPTPEGNEAQQEATPVEVAPAMLLTSPTARVTPRGENITMNISGSGNVDNEEIIGIINQQLQQQTSIGLDMNVYQTDNLTKLDSSFYEQKISNALGLN